VTWEETRNKDASDEDREYPMDKTPTHQEEQGNQKRKQPNSNTYQVNWQRHQQESSENDKEMNWHI